MSGHYLHSVVELEVHFVHQRVKAQRRRVVELELVLPLRAHYVHPCRPQRLGLLDARAEIARRWPCLGTHRGSGLPDGDCIRGRNAGSSPLWRHGGALARFTGVVRYIRHARERAKRLAGRRLLGISRIPHSPLCVLNLAERPLLVVAHIGARPPRADHHSQKHGCRQPDYRFHAHLARPLQLPLTQAWAGSMDDMSPRP